MMRQVVCLVLAMIVCMPADTVAQAPARNIVIVTIDGLRWQEFFNGADATYFKKADGKMCSGAADPRINSNDKLPNPNLTVLEWLNTRPGLAGRVRAYGAWDVLPFILNVDRRTLPVGSGFAPVASPRTEQQRAINQLAEDLPPFWDYGTFDAPMVAAAIESLRSEKPRVLDIMLGEGDEWAHINRCDLYLDAARRADRFSKRIWDTLQSLPDYRGTTALLVTTDHGRGATTKDWMDHGRDNRVQRRFAQRRPVQCAVDSDRELFRSRLRVVHSIGPSAG